MIIRLGAYAGVFALMAALEALAPKRRLRTPKSARWLSNISVTFLGAALVIAALAWREGRESFEKSRGGSCGCAGACKG